LDFRPRPALSATSIVALALGALVLAQPAAPALTVLAREGRRSIPLALVGDQEFVGLDDLSAAFQLTSQESLGAITVTYKGKTIVLTPDQALASVAGRLISLPAPPSRSGRRWLVPVEFISRALAPIFDSRLELRKPAHLLIVGDLRVPRVALRYEAVGAAGRLVVDATPRAASTVSQDNDRISIKFEADALDAPTPLLATLPAGALIQGVRLSDPLTITVDLTPRFAGFKATSQPVENTARLVLEFTPPTDTAPAPTAPGQTAPPPPGQPGAQPAQPAPGTPQPPPELPPALGQPVSPIRSIAIDPGHGGDDEGVRGANGLKEKDLALAVARRLRGALEARLGIRVLLTRDDDRNVPINDRTSLANNNKADLFASIHVNAALRKVTSGATIFLAAFDERAMQSAATHAPQRVPAFGGGMRDLEMVPWDLAQTRHVERSTAFAELLRAQLQDRVPLAARPIDQAPLRVLESANMPAVLIELGYLSNPDQEKLIGGDGFQNTFVQAFYDAVVRYRDSLQNGGTR
jgi:N-acetylmuramoyl-L-alanine amidase